MQRARHRSVGPSLAPSYVVSAVSGTMPHSDSLRTALDFGVALYQDALPWLSTFATGCGRASPVDRLTFAACRLPYAGAVPGCSRIYGPDCCLRHRKPGSAHSTPYGQIFSARQSSLGCCSLQRCSSSLRRPDFAGRRRIHYRAPLAACPGGTSTRWSFGPLLGTLSGQLVVYVGLTPPLSRTRQTAILWSCERQALRVSDKRARTCVAAAAAATATTTARDPRPPASESYPRAATWEGAVFRTEPGCASLRRGVASSTR